MSFLCIWFELHIVACNFIFCKIHQRTLIIIISLTRIFHIHQSFFHQISWFGISFYLLYHAGTNKNSHYLKYFSIMKSTTISKKEEKIQNMTNTSKCREKCKVFTIILMSIFLMCLFEGQRLIKINVKASSYLFVCLRD